MPLKQLTLQVKHVEKETLEFFFKDETLHHYLHPGHQINFFQVNITLHAC